MDQAKEAIRELGKKIKRHYKRVIQASIVLIFLGILLASAVYYITVDDGTYKEDDWSSTPYGASQYKNGVTVDADGDLKNSITAQELWDKMLENKSRVDEYLDSPEELARLMRAEIVTKYPDTRPDPDEAIDWDKLIENPDVMQGIIKFKRADNNGNKSTMKYVSPSTFQSYIDEYNKTGSETAKQKALNSFTLKKASSGTSNNNPNAVAAGDGVMTDISQIIIDATNRTAWPGAQLCAKWVDDVFDNAGVGACRHKSAYESFKHHGISTDMSAIPIGAAVYGTGSGSTGHWGHIGIYIGSGQVIDSQNGGIKISSMEDWLYWQVDVIDGQRGWLGWGWEDNNRIRGTTEDPSVKEDNSKDKEDDKNDSKKEKEKNKEENIQKATVTPVEGDGYSELYTSSAGITYKHFKQVIGSYAQNPYWSGTIYNSGCGPTSVAILASGLLNSSYTPADIAAEMNNVYGFTSYDTLKREMESLGMACEVIQSPSAETIQDNLRNGKVMLVSVNSSTIFTGGSHIMAIVDINEQGQVYICNPSSMTKQGWYDVNELMAGCDYIITTEAGAAGIASTSNSATYTAVVATWTQVDTTITSNDPNVGDDGYTRYSMTTTNINYEEMVDVYTMPFDMLWALLVVGEDKNFIFELIDLIYNSDIQITIHDNLTTNTDIDEWHYTKRQKAEVDATIRAHSAGKNATSRVQCVHVDDEPYKTTKTVVTQTNTLNVALTKADVWIVKYENEFTYVGAVEGEPITNKVTKPNEEYSELPTSTDNSYSCEDINNLKAQLKERVKTTTTNSTSSVTTTTTVEPVEFHENIEVKYYTKYIDIYDKISNQTTTQKYVQGIPEFEEKTDKKSKEPNFVTIFRKSKYKKNKSKIKDAAEWLFEIIENNDSTADMLDLIKYLLYKATGTSYDGIESFDFSIFYPGGLVTVGEGDYIVHIDKSSPDIVIEDVETLKRAFAGYSGGSKLVEHAQEFLDLQEKYRVNAVFAAAVSISETGAGRAGNAVNGKNNWFNIECVHGKSHGRFETYGSVKESIEEFYKLIAVKNYYFTAGNFTVRDIGMTYCENADAPGGWIENTTTFMTQMFNAAGIKPTTSGTSQRGEKIVEAAKSKLDCAYVYGASGPDTFDCSGFTMWCYKQVGIEIPHQSESQKGKATKKVSVSEARVGDILWKQGHVGIYIGNNQYIHATKPGDVVRISDNASGYFTYALQFD